MRISSICLAQSHNPATSPIFVCASSLTLLLADTNSSSSSTRGLRVLTSDSETPVVSKTTMGTDLLQSLQIFTKFALHAVCQNLGVLAIDDVALSIEEPRWDLVLCRVLDDCDNSLEFFGCDFTSSAQYVSPLAAPDIFNPRTACSNRHQPSCRPSWSIFGLHP